MKKLSAFITATAMLLSLPAISLAQTYTTPSGTSSSSSSVTNPSNNSSRNSSMTTTTPSGATSNTTSGTTNGTTGGATSGATTPSGGVRAGFGGPAAAGVDALILMVLVLGAGTVIAARRAQFNS